MGEALEVQGGLGAEVDGFQVGGEPTVYALHLPLLQRFVLSYCNLREHLLQASVESVLLFIRVLREAVLQVFLETVLELGSCFILLI